MATATTPHPSLDDLIDAAMLQADTWLTKSTALTSRAVEVLTYIAEGMSYQEIAERMFITRKTVEGHITGISSALGIIGKGGGGRILAFLSVVYAARTNGKGEPLFQEVRKYHFEPTPRQSQILQLVGIGMSNKEIATTLYISKSAVENHINAVLAHMEHPHRKFWAYCAWQVLAQHQQRQYQPA